jgi:hypothetical protein
MISLGQKITWTDSTAAVVVSRTTEDRVTVSVREFNGTWGTWDTDLYMLTYDPEQGCWIDDRDGTTGQLSDLLPWLCAEADPVEVVDQPQFGL